MAEIEWDPSALEELETLDSAVRERILKKVTWFAENFELQNPIPLSGNLSGYYKLRIGDYRVIYSVKDNRLIVEMIGHRKDIRRIIFQTPASPYAYLCFR